MPLISPREVEELQQSLIEVLTAGSEDTCDAVNILRLLLSESSNIGERNTVNGVESSRSGAQTPRWLSFFTSITNKFLLFRCHWVVW